jgi:long-chain acyl-CoA synthetase
MMTMAKATMTTDDALFVSGDLRISRETYEHRVARAMSVLRELSLGEGDCIGIAFRNRPQFFELLAAATAMGIKAVPIAWRLKAEEVRYLVQDSKAKAVFFDPDSASQMTGLPGVSLDEYEKRLATAKPAEDSTGAINMLKVELYSSGTTGRPKAIERDIPKQAAGQVPNMRNIGFLDLLGVPGPGEVHLLCGPLYHSQPIGFAASALAAGQRVVMMEGGFDAETCLRTIAREKVTWLTCVPTHFVRILALPEDVRRRYDLSSVKAVLHSASPCPRDVKSAIVDLFPPDTVWEIYGGTEGAMTMISPQEWRKKPGSVGRAFPSGSELRVLDPEGNLLPPGTAGLVYAKPMTKFRYRGSPELDRQTWRDGMFTLGDIGYLDEDGYLFITDRLKDMIITGGANVYPAEVEAVLFNHPAVADVAVIGVPDPQWGERIKAIVELRAAATAEDIMSFCRQHIAHYKCPTSVDFVAEFPRDPNGKVRKRDLREKYWSGAGRSV